MIISIFTFDIFIFEVVRIISQNHLNPCLLIIKQINENRQDQLKTNPYPLFVDLILIGRWRQFHSRNEQPLPANGHAAYSTRLLLLLSPAFYFHQKLQGGRLRQAIQTQLSESNSDESSTLQGESYH